MNRDISNSADIIDSRNLVERVEELERTLAGVDCHECGGAGVLGDGKDAPGCAHCNECGCVDMGAMTAAEREAHVEYQEWTDEHEELLRLRALVEELNSASSDSADDGITMIRDSYFEQYARDLADDIGAVSSDASWPNTCIDWEKAASELQVDYSTVDYDGVTYWVR